MESLEEFEASIRSKIEVIKRIPSSINELENIYRETKKLLFN